MMNLIKSVSTRSDRQSRNPIRPELRWDAAHNVLGKWLMNSMLGNQAAW